MNRICKHCKTDCSNLSNGQLISADYRREKQGKKKYRRK